MPFSEQLTAQLSNPLNWVLLVLVGLVIRNVAANARAPAPVAPPPPPEPIVLRNFTHKELAQYNGVDGAPIYIAVLGRVYDMTRGKDFYGPGGPYANFAGRDATRGLAKNSFDAEMMSDPNGPIDKLEDLDAEERNSAREWAGMFEFKYDHIGFLVDNDYVEKKEGAEDIPSA